MKKNLLSILVMFAIIISGFSQVPDAFNYQAVVRNSAGEIIVNQNVSFKISILQDSETGTAVYVETHSITTSSFGLANLQIGQGTFVSGAFSPDAWGSNSHFIKVELDPAGGSSYTFLGTSQLLSVPYAFHAETSNSSQWLNDNDDIYFNTNGRVGIGLLVGGSDVKLQVKATTGHAIASESNSVVGTVYAKNLGTGPAGDFRNHLRIIDGTQGAGKVLTSDAGGLTSWQTPSAGLWMQDGSDLYFNSGKIGIGKIPGADLRQFQVKTAGFQAIAGENNSATYGTIYANNLGTGPAADFRSHLKILDGTQGAGKVLTSDAGGLTSWQTPSSSGPLAYGMVQADGTLKANSGNISVSNTTTGRYEITITGESYVLWDYITVVSLVNIGYIKHNSLSGKLIIYTYNTSGVAANAIFTFVVYKP